MTERWGINNAEEQNLILIWALHLLACPFTSGCSWIKEFALPIDSN